MILASADKRYLPADAKIIESLTPGKQRLPAQYNC